YQAFSNASDDEMRNRFNGMRYGDLKKQVAGIVIANLEPFQERYRRITSEPGYLEGILREGAERVAPIANQTVAVAKQRLGLYTLVLARHWHLIRTDQNLRLLWLAQVVSEMGDWFYSLSVYNLLLELTHHKAQSVGLAVVLQVLPHTVVAPATGVINDRIS